MIFSKFNRRGGLAASLVIVTLIVIVAGVAWTQHSVPPTPTARPTDLGAALITKRSYPSLSYGIQASLWWNDTLRPRDLEVVRQMRFGYVKQIFNWKDIEPDPNASYDWQHADAVVDEVQYRGLKLIARLSGAPDWAIKDQALPFDVTAFGSYCSTLATRYKGRIAGYEVWNEPNLTREWSNKPPDAAGYVKLLASCYQAIKQADPDAVVISAGLAPTGGDGIPTDATPDEDYLNAMYAAGASAYYDVLGIHAAGYKSPPETPPDDPALGGNRWQVFRHVEDIRAIMVAHGDGAKQIAILEMGWTTDTRPTSDFHWHAVTEAQQADYLAGAYRYAALHWRPWVGLMITIYIPDSTWTQNDEQYWWSIMTSGYNPFFKPAFFALANMERYKDDTFIPAQDPGKPQYTPMPPRK